MREEVSRKVADRKTFDSNWLHRDGSRNKCATHVYIFDCITKEKKKKMWKTKLGIVKSYNSRRGGCHLKNKVYAKWTKWFNYKSTPSKNLTQKIPCKLETCHGSPYATWSSHWVFPPSPLVTRHPEGVCYWCVDLST